MIMKEEPDTLEVASGKFAKGLQTLHAENCSFTAYVRLEYEQIEQAIKAGIPLDKIGRLLCESYGVHGTLSALKSALRRIRLAKGGWAQQKWLDANAPLPQAGPSGGSMADRPAMISQQGPRLLEDPLFGGPPKMPQPASQPYPMSSAHPRDVFAAHGHQSGWVSPPATAFGFGHSSTRL
ncbi:hypothetical protein J4761_19530 [Burkholderia pseudomallei]|uniref:hypothetical protein n=1 Tax=Burkholderia pseudomallei TaxID=28450 RepID=UPI001AAFE7D4|nr:hypothetical protein [Burkholderia pseudomallei]MBO2962220.1 hypothetical protein [Burkholderia pseudomallei]MBO7841667.1 hypothetical protein [Burkholderia pseudomallei]